MNTIVWSNNAKTEYANLLQVIYDRSVDEAIALDERTESLQNRLEAFKTCARPTPKSPTCGVA